MTDNPQSFPEIGSPEQNKSSSKRYSVTIEPLIFTYFFLFSLTDGVSTNVLISKTCNVVYGLPFDVCDGQLDPNIEGLVQSYTTKITMMRTILESVITGVISMFVGSWSDVNGRKPFIVIPIAGSALYYISWYIFVNLPTISPLWVLVPSVFSSLSGGLVGLFICVFCYITDITNETNRAFRMATIYSTMTLGTISGYLSSNLILKIFGNSTVMIIFSVASGCSFIALLYAVFILPESKIPEQRFSRSFFNLKSIQEIWVTVFMHRHKKVTLIILLESLIIVIGSTIIVGDISYKYYALRKGFGWTLEEYNIYSGILAGVSVIASTIGSYISCSILRVHDLYIALFVALTSSLSNVLLALSRTSIEFYLFSVVGCFGLLLNPMLKSQISRTVELSNLGKYFSFISTLEAFVPLLSSPLYRTVYNAVLDKQPLLFFFLSASFWLLSSILVLAVLLIQAFGTRNYEELLINEERDGSSSNTPGIEANGE